tara:strand:- start:238 stop:492 length:255 start_codon:yes stop_codon:yes gene_type:complete
MNLQLLIALVVITETGEIDPDRKSYFINTRHCEWVVQEMVRERKYFQGFEEDKIFCRPEWVDANSVKITRLNVIPMPEVEEYEP